MGERGAGFPSRLRRRVRSEQGFRCGDCGASCRGHEFNEPVLEIHHITPRRYKGGCQRENAVGLCPGCHELHNTLTIEQGKNYFQVLMEQDRWYDLKAHPGNPFREEPLVLNQPVFGRAAD